MNRLSLGLAKTLMKLAPHRPTPPDVAVGTLQEVFRHPCFVDGSPQVRRDIMRRSAEAEYAGETDYPWDHYFGMPLRPLLEGADALDLGCFTGGRSIAWQERYAIRSMTGIDVAPAFVEAANRFAATKRADASFALARGERLPFEDGSFDAILSFDVLEHVQDVAGTLAECRRVLKPGGVFCLVFPGYFQPVEHHLTLATRMPFLQLAFGSATLVRAYYEILAERGPEAAWYARPSPALQNWERGNTINGTTYAGFRRIAGEQHWQTVHDAHRPIGSIGRHASRLRWLGPLARLLLPLTYVPGLQEVFLHRIAVILRKPAPTGHQGRAAG